MRQCALIHGTMKLSLRSFLFQVPKHRSLYRPRGQRKSEPTIVPHSKPIPTSRKATSRLVSFQCNMDGTKRKRSSFSLIDFGNTPPWALPPTLYEESAIRSTQGSPQAPQWSPISNAFNFKAATQNGDIIVEQDLDVDEDEDEDEEVYVDTANDAVYMINAKEGSW